MTLNMNSQGVLEMINITELICFPQFLPIVLIEAFFDLVRSDL